MQAIFAKELRQFFSNLTGYIAIVVFLLLNGLFLFVFSDNLFDMGYATLDRFFDLAPWILLLLVPAITMRSLSEEFRGGTFETLRTRPVTLWQIIIGKYLACLTVVGLALIPTLVYLITLQNLAAQGGIDIGGTIGSYIGLFFLAAVFVAAGICCSSFSQNAVVGFLSAAFICFVMYSGFQGLSSLPAFSANADYYLEMLGIDFHYRSMSRGVIDAPDLIYFLSLVLVFLLLTRRSLNKR
jgi:ABC-2 type transport system permease protein